jgi:hypothetical protein
MSPIAIGQEQLPLMLLMEQSYLGVYEFPDAEEAWLGVYRKIGGYEARWTTIDVTVTESDESCRTYTAVSVGSEDSPLFLIHGLNGVVEGDIDVVIDFPETGANRDRYLQPGESEQFSYGDMVYTVGALGRAHQIEYDSGIGVADYRFLIRRRSQSSYEYLTQLVGPVDEVSPDRPPTLQWVGDLDRDGELDFLFDLAWHYNVRLFTLFLSSLRTDEALVKKAAELSIVGC